MPIEKYSFADITENKMLNIWGQYLSRSPLQLNKMHESDAELFLVDGDKVIAATIDTIAEEITLGFYADPETIGWMAATVSLSDLAAAAAQPLGIVPSVCLPAKDTENFQRGIATGLEAACRHAGTFVLGGDTNQGEQASISCCAIGLTEKTKVRTRMGIKSGDVIFSTGKFGEGNALAAAKLLGLNDLYSEKDFRPIARLREARIICEFATAVMDTSDGLIGCLDQLSRLNQVGIEIATPIEDLVRSKALKVAHALSAPPLVMLAADHGEFELVFSIPSQKQEEFVRTCQSTELNPVMIGKATDINNGIRLSSGRGSLALDTTKLRNLWTDCKGNISLYLETLIKLCSG